ncbi:prothymosin alpha isoform X4 [Papio anubis]|uniref:prothymosin alpha isoform X4 n=1 Tax=Papio anubis TaxID=9555 RepID=UPI0012AE4E69|nr:prothymosin alpha isoform X4 [Papio anubis]
MEPCRPLPNETEKGDSVSLLTRSASSAGLGIVRPPRSHTPGFPHSQLGCTGETDGRNCQWKDAKRQLCVRPPLSANVRSSLRSPAFRVGRPLLAAQGRTLPLAILCVAQDLKEKKEVVEEAENGRDAPANGNANEENGEQEADNEVDEEEEEGGEEEEEEEEGDGEEEDGDEDEEAESATGKRAAEDDEDDDVDTKKQKTDEDD